MNFLSSTWLSVHSPSPQISFLLLHRQGVSRFPNPPHTKERGSQILRARLVVLPTYYHPGVQTFFHPSQMWIWVPPHHAFAEAMSEGSLDHRITASEGELHSNLGRTPVKKGQFKQASSVEGRGGKS